MPFLKKGREGFLLLVHIQPQSRKSEVVGIYNDRLKIKINAPPVDGAANDELIRFLAKTLGLRQKDFAIEAGQTSRQKSIRIASDASIDTLRSLLSTKTP